MAAMLLQELGVSHHNGKQAQYITFLPALHSILAEVLVVLTSRLAPQVRREARKRRQNVCVWAHLEPI
jgi:hypothetical protein